MFIIIIMIKFFLRLSFSRFLSLFLTIFFYFSIYSLDILSLSIFFLLSPSPLVVY